MRVSACMRECVNACMRVCECLHESVRVLA